MPSFVTPKKNAAYEFYVSLTSQANGMTFQSSPTLAIGDVVTGGAGGTLANITTLPSVSPAGSKVVKVSLSAAEMNFDNVTVVFSDVAGAEWCDLTVNIQTTANQIDDLALASTTATSSAVAAVQADTDNIQTRIPAALIGGRIDASVGAYQSGQAPLQPTDAGRTLDVAATGEAGLDFDNIKQATGATTLTNIRVPNITLVDTITTYTGNTPQTGDSFSRIGAPAGASIAADIAANLAAVQNVQNNTFVASNIPVDLERPDSGSESITWTVVFADETGAAKNLDSAATPTITLVNPAGTSRASRLSAWTNPATGKYTLIYTSSASDPVEYLTGELSGTINSKLRRLPFSMQIVDTTAVDFTSTDRATLAAIAANTDVTTSSRMATFTLPTNFAALGIGAGGHILNVDTVANAVTVGTINTDAISAAAVSAGAVTKIQVGLATASALATDTADILAAIAAGGNCATTADVNAARDAILAVGSTGPWTAGGEVIEITTTTNIIEVTVKRP